MSANSPVTSIKDQRATTLAAEITELYGYITAATYEFLVKVREFDEHKLWAGPGLASCAHWLNWQCGIGMNAAREKVRVARALGSLPKISEAFRRGEVSFSKVRAMTRFATPESEDYLLMIARNGTANHVETLVRGYRRAERLHAPDSAEHQYETRSFHYHWDDDGSLVFQGRLPAEVGAMMMKALQSSIDQKQKDICPKGTSTSESQAEDAGYCESVSQKRADAIAKMAESYLKHGPAESSSADRYQVMLHVHRERMSTAETSPQVEDCPDVTAETTSHVEDGPHVTAETSKRICCDTSVSRIVESEIGKPISIGRKSRVIPPAMRRALKARDKQCRFPGCTHQHFIDGHHIKHWADGGETSLDNLVQLCRFHHRLVHEGGFSCERNEGDGVVFRNPAGDLVPVTGRMRCYSERRANPVGVITHLREKLEDRFINEQTIRPDWHGEAMDNDLAVGHLWDIEHRGTFTRRARRPL